MIYVIYNFLDVWTYLSVVSSDISTFSIISEFVNVGSAIIVDTSVVSASFVTIIAACSKGVLVANFVLICDCSVVRVTTVELGFRCAENS